MKKYICAVLVIMMMWSMCGCQKEDEAVYEACKTGFMSVNGSQLYESPDGYYFIAGNYLMFADQTLERTVPVCGKAECLHQEESPENLATCDAFFNGITSISYNGGKLYVLANQTDEEGSSNAIYEVSIDGSERSVLAESTGFFYSFLTNYEDCIVYEKHYADEQGVSLERPLLRIWKFSVQNPKKQDILFETDAYLTGDINYLTCMNDDIYFQLNGETQESYTSLNMRIDLESREVSQIGEDNSQVYLLQDGVIFRNVLESNEDLTWTDTYYRMDWDSEKKTELTEADFASIGQNTYLQVADDSYLYFADICYGVNMVPEEEQKYTIYTHDGDIVCEIPYNKLIDVLAYYAGNQKYLFQYRQSINESGQIDLVFEYVEKETMGKKPEVHTLFQGSLEDYTGIVVY